MSKPVLAPKVGIAAVIRNGEGQIVLGKRAGSHGAGTWAFPGGHLEMGESIFTCAEREVAEETGLKVKGVKNIAITNDVFDETKHYITIFVLCVREDVTAEPQRLEPNKCEGWHWKSWDEIKTWCAHHDDTSSEWTDKKCFLPIINFFKEHGDMDLSHD